MNTPKIQVIRTQKDDKPAVEEIDAARNPIAKFFDAKGEWK